MFTSKSPSSPGVMQSFLTDKSAHPKIATHLVIKGKISLQEGV